MEENEIEIDEATFQLLSAISEADDDALSLAATANLDPKEFREFLRQTQQSETPEALALMRAAEALYSSSNEVAALAIAKERGSLFARLRYLLLGGGIGAALGLLFAPKRGYELRGDLAYATRKGIDKSREASQQLGERAGEYYESTRERAGELYEQAASKAAEVYTQASEKVGEVAESARDTARRQTSTVAAALDAGKKAYQEEKRKTELSGRVEAAPHHDEKVN